ncbi:hypothetical protein Lal_00017347 [Lupinus albus]|uniref:Uncharacterized protein n=1 Tax=Lupinus albus TaxID=3870 RepID=A0A6A4QQJ3_LUPAL|nr:hypothetical protein Lalb_Chr04g0260731 [Lupinus albus]KAF1869770.1 hypothetical protein Lal_00017347 [Lupinus albus]
MVAKTPPKQNKVLASLNYVLIKETLNKVDRCMARLQELQYTVAGGTKVVSGVSLSPRSTRAYLRTSLRCKQESLRIKNSAPRRSPQGKFPRPATLEGEWRQMSLPAMLVGETLGEILQASQFAREIVSAVARKTSIDDPKTPLPQQRSSQKKLHSENTELKARRKKEKQIKQQSDSPPSLQRARSRINFKVSPPKIREFDKENNKHLANRVSPRNRPWARKAVLFPNPLFSSTTSSSMQQQFCKTKSPILSRNRGTPQHKFLIKSSSPPSASKFQVKVQKSPPIVSIYSSTRATSLSKNSPKKSAASKLSRPFSPSRLVTRLASPLRSKKSVQKSDSLGKSSPKRSSVSKFRQSFSPSRLATRLVSPLKSKTNVQQSHGYLSGLKQRPESTMQIPSLRI